jgi:hypothetical protein
MEQIVHVAHQKSTKVAPEIRIVCLAPQIPFALPQTMYVILAMNPLLSVDVEAVSRGGTNRILATSCALLLRLVA